MSAQQLDPLDLYDIRSELSEDEVMVKDTVGRFVDDQVIPLMREAFEKHVFPRHLVAEVAESDVGSVLERFRENKPGGGTGRLPRNGRAIRSVDQDGIHHGATVWIDKVDFLDACGQISSGEVDRRVPSGANKQVDSDFVLC